MEHLFNLRNIAHLGSADANSVTVRKSFSLAVKNPAGCEDCMILSSRAKYRGTAPTVHFELVIAWEDGREEVLYQSGEYKIGHPVEFTNQQWRVPPMFENRIHACVVVTVPEDSELILLDFHNHYSTAVKDWNGGLRFNSHLGFTGMAPNNTMPAFEIAAQCGFPACIVVPKLTKDGKLVCIHDDTINRTARDENGNPPAEEMFVWDMTYEELQKWDFGSYVSDIYKGTKIPLLDDFFALCSRTGMRPMFSTHPNLPIEKWKEVRQMLVKHGLLRQFHVKSFRIKTLEEAYSVFGEDIDGYTWDEGNVEELKQSKVAQTKLRLGIERGRYRTTEENVRESREAGFFSAMYSLGRCAGEDYREYIRWGVTEFTEDYHCSMGLNW